MTIIGPYPYTFVNGTVIDAPQVNSDFSFVQSQVNANAAASGVNSDITNLTALTNFTSAAGTVTGLLSAGTLAVSGASTFDDDITMTGTGGLSVAAGTTAQRPVSPNLGEIRYNTTLSGWEGYGGIPAGWGPLSGSSMSLVQGLFIANSGIAPTTTMFISIRQIQMKSDIGSIIYRTGVTGTVSISSSGAGGIDTGTVQPNSYYAVYAIDNGVTTNFLLSLRYTTPVLPSGYIYYQRLGTVQTTSSSQVFSTVQRGNRIEILPASFSSYVLVTSTSSLNTFVTVPVGNFVPNLYTNEVFVLFVYTCTSTSTLPFAELYTDASFDSRLQLVQLASTGAGSGAPAQQLQVNSAFFSGDMSIFLSGGPATVSVYLAGWKESVPVF